jgi:hypothetical protein
MTIGFTQLGNYGRMGNQMFQYASLRGVAANLGYDWVVPTQEKFKGTYHSTSNIFECFTLEKARANMSDVNFKFLMKERDNTNAFDERIFYTCLDETDLMGYFQSPRYFNNIEQEIKNEFTFIKKSPLNVSEYIFVHVRRGDYLLYPYILTVQNEEYYRQGLSCFDSSLPVVVMSDDIEWCKNASVFQGKRFIFSEFNPYDDLLIMSKSLGGITSNSTYGWWGAYLSNSKNVIIPSNWFGPAAVGHSASEFLINDWMML